MYDFVEEMGYSGTYGVLVALKQVGAIDMRDTIADLGEYDPSGTYDGMMKFLTESLM